jgi:hypothetical protein
MSLRILSSFSRIWQSMASTGSPHLSFFVWSSVMRLRWSGSISPNAVAPMRHDPGSAALSLNSPPMPSSATARDQPSRLALPW